MNFAPFALELWCPYLKKQLPAGDGCWMNVRSNSSLILAHLAVYKESDFKRTHLYFSSKSEKIVSSDGSGENTRSTIHRVADVGQHVGDRDNRVVRVKIAIEIWLNMERDASRLCSLLLSCYFNERVDASFYQFKVNKS